MFRKESSSIHSRTIFMFRMWYGSYRLPLHCHKDYQVMNFCSLFLSTASNANIHDHGAIVNVIKGHADHLFRHSVLLSRHSDFAK